MRARGNHKPHLFLNQGIIYGGIQLELLGPFHCLQSNYHMANTFTITTWYTLSFLRSELSYLTQDQLKHQQQYAQSTITSQFRQEPEAINSPLLHTLPCFPLYADQWPVENSPWEPQSSSLPRSTLQSPPLDRMEPAERHKPYYKNTTKYECHPITKISVAMPLKTVIIKFNKQT